MGVKNEGACSANESLIDLQDGQKRTLRNRDASFFIRFLPFFCFSSCLRLRAMSLPIVHSFRDLRIRIQRLIGKRDFWQIIG